MAQSNQELNEKHDDGHIAVVTNFSSFDSGEAYGKIKQAEINFKNDATEILKKKWPN